MKTGNQPLTAFEESRRLVDKNPADALTKFGTDPTDAEDFFLVGRAHFLLSHFIEAKKAFTTARERIAAGEVDPNNAKTIETEIAIANAIINDPTAQGNLKANLEGPKPAANADTPAPNTNQR